MSKNLLHGGLDLKMSRSTDECVRLIGVVSDAYDVLLATLTEEQKPCSKSSKLLLKITDAKKSIISFPKASRRKSLWEGGN